MNRRTGLLLVVMAGVVVSCWYLAHFEGDPKPVDPLLVVPLHEAAPAGLSQPALVQNINEPTAIYVVSGGTGPDGLFEALRVDVNSGARSSARIRFGPNTTYLPFDSADAISSFASITEVAKGLSTTTCLPAWSAARAISKCVGDGEATTTRSMAGSESSSATVAAT